MKITVRVTKKLIERHWNGCGTMEKSCPIHGALMPKIKGILSVGKNSIVIDAEPEIDLTYTAAIFSSGQAKFIDDQVWRKEEALRILKPITFSLDIPKRYLRKGVRG